MRVSKMWVAAAGLSLLAVLHAEEPSALPALAKEISHVARDPVGLCVLVGCGDDALALELGRAGHGLVQDLEPDPECVCRARQRAMETGLAGRVTFAEFANTLPYADGLVDLIVLGSNPSSTTNTSLLRDAWRTLAPAGKIVVLKTVDGNTGAADGQKIMAALQTAGVTNFSFADASARLMTITKLRSPLADDWSQWGHDAGDSFVSQDRLFGPSMTLQWLTGPCNAGGGNLILSAQGRNFYVMSAPEVLLPSFHADPNDETCVTGRMLIARNADNGLPLWRRRYEGNARTLVAVREHLLTQEAGELVALHASTGAIDKRYGALPNLQQLLVQDDLILALTKPENQPATVQAIRLESGTRAWTCEHDDVAKILIASNTVLLCGSKDKKPTLYALALSSGVEQWHTAQSGEMRCVKQGLILVANRQNLQGLSVTNGQVLWRHEFFQAQGCSSEEILFADGLVWVSYWVNSDPSPWLIRSHRYIKWDGLDPRSGQVQRSLEVPYYIPYSCYPAIATEQYSVLRRPNDLMEWTNGNIHEFRATRNGCRTSAIIAGGQYATIPNHCSCFPGMIRGFAAFASESPSATETSGVTRLITGSAHPAAVQPAGDNTQQEADWPMYRHDAGRSGSSAVEMPAQLAVIWEKTIAVADVPRTLVGGEWQANPLGSARLTAPVVAGGQVCVGVPELHRVVALDAADGRERWAFNGEGRLDLPPSLQDGLCLFGTYAGYVYGLRVADGALVWRYQAAPRTRLLVAFGQLESRWPVVGGVLVYGGLAYAVCGRSTETDGGLAVHALDPQSGNLVWRATPERLADNGFKGLADLLVCDERAIAIGGSPCARFDPVSGRHLPKSDFFALRALFRVRPKDSFLANFGVEGENYGVLLGRDPCFGAVGGRQNIEDQKGRLLVFDASEVFSYFEEYAENGSQPKHLHTWLQAKRRGRTEVLRWRMELAESVSVQALSVCKNMLYVATQCKEKAGPVRNEIWGVARKDGTVVWKHEFQDAVIPEGLSIAGKRLYLTTESGQVICLGEGEPATQQHSLNLR